MKFCIILIAFLCIFLLYREYTVMDSWTHHKYRMRSLGELVKKNRDILLKKDEHPVTMKGFLQDIDPNFSQHGIESMVIPNRALVEENIILYWWPIDISHSTVFITASPLRRWFSSRYVRLCVDINGEDFEVDSQRFLDLVKQSRVCE
jgi:hypothetical protein